MQNFTKLNIHGYPDYPVNTYHIGDNRGGLWGIHSQTITNSQKTEQVKFLGGFRLEEFYIEWIAIGY